MLCRTRKPPRPVFGGKIRFPTYRTRARIITGPSGTRPCSSSGMSRYDIIIRITDTRRAELKLDGRRPVRVYIYIYIHIYGSCITGGDVCARVCVHCFKYSKADGGRNDDDYAFFFLPSRYYLSSQLLLFRGVRAFSFRRYHYRYYYYTPEDWKSYKRRNTRVDRIIFSKIIDG